MTADRCGDHKVVHAGSDCLDLRVPADANLSDVVLATFFCGGSRNFAKFIHLFDAVLVLEVDLATLHRRLDDRPDEEWGGGVPTERDRIVQWHETKADVPANGIVIDATAPLEKVVDEILRHCQTGGE